MVDGGDVVSPMGSDDWSWVGILTGQADEARRVQVRVQDLFNRGIATQAQLDEAITTVEVAQAAIGQAEANLAVARLPARGETIKVAQQYLEGAITNGERKNKVIAVWSEVTEKIADEMFSEMESRNCASVEEAAAH